MRAIIEQIVQSDVDTACTELRRIAIDNFTGNAAHESLLVVQEDRGHPEVPLVIEFVTIEVDRFPVV